MGLTAGADLEISKGGFFLLLWLAGYSQPHPLSIVFLAKGGGVLLNFENNRRTPPRSASGEVYIGVSTIANS